MKASEYAKVIPTEMYPANTIINDVSVEVSVKKAIPL